MAGILAALIFGRRRWYHTHADPNCRVCRGTGLAGVDRVEPCVCAWMGFKAAVQRRGFEDGQRERASRQASLAQQNRQARRQEYDVVNARIHGNSGWIDILTPGQTEQQRIEAYLRAKARPEVVAAMGNNQLTLCCAQRQCRCGVNHWRRDEMPPEPPITEPARSAWLAWRQYVLSR